VPVTRNRLAVWLVRIAAALVAVVLLAAGGVFALSQSRLRHAYALPSEIVPHSSDPAFIARGHHVAITSGCISCHGEHLAGRVVFENAMVGRFVAANLTSGKGGVGGKLADADWIHAIRHGVGTDGRSLLAMPSREFYVLSDEDLGALIAYLKTIPPVDNELAASALSPMGRVLLLAINDIALLSAERIDHNAPRPTPPPVGITTDYGKYLAVRCTGCHGDTLSGGKIPGTPPEWPPALNLTPYPGAAVAQWSEAEFVSTLRTGKTPRGNQLENRFMPWKVLGQMTDDELKALWLYLKSAPAKEYGNR
jgi:mono/diheme cytochrome c family protein